MPAVESFTGVVARVWPGTVGPVRAPHSIIMRVVGRGTQRFYSWDDWIASFCEAAVKPRRDLRIDYENTPWGHLILKVDYAC